MDGEAELVGIWLTGNMTRRWSSIPVLTGLDVEQFRWLRPASQHSTISFGILPTYLSENLAEDIAAGRAICAPHTLFSAAGEEGQSYTRLLGLGVMQ